MPLLPGSKLPTYEILGSLGAGAMGEVYRAKDMRLGREVAIKVLPEHFADDEERLRRSSAQGWSTIDAAFPGPTGSLSATPFALSANARIAQ